MGGLPLRGAVQRDWGPSPKKTGQEALNSPLQELSDAVWLDQAFKQSLRVDQGYTGRHMARHWDGIEASFLASRIH